MNRFGTEITSDEIIDTLSFFDDWEERYRYIIDLGKELPPMDPAEQREENLVRGCQSQVWLVARVDPAGGVMRLELDSDAHIVRGLIAIVLAAYDGRTPREILQFDIEALFDELDLLRHLSLTRGNGLRAMVEAIRRTAAEAENASAG